MEDQDEELLRIRTILKENPKGLTIEEIAKKLPLNRTSTAKYLNTLLISGQAEMRTFGRAKVFTISQRVPFSQMLNLSSDLLMVLDHDLTINQVNESLLKTLNLRKESLVGMKITGSPIASFLTGKNLDIVRESSQGKEITKLDRVEINGKEYFFRIKMIPVVFDQGGQGLAIVLEDITELKQYQQHLEQLVEERTREVSATNARLLEEIKERKRSQAALEHSERKYRELVENANSIILRLDKAGTITFFNEFAQHFFGIPEPEILGKNITDIICPIHELSGDLRQEALTRFLKPTENLTFNEAECFRKEGEPVWVAWTSKRILDPNGEFSEYLLVGMDITERKQVENALHQVNAKLNLVSSIARHDILNRLTIVHGNLDLLKIQLTDPLQIELVVSAEKALSAIQRQIEFTRDYKDMGVKKAYWQPVTATIHQVIADKNVNGISIAIPPEGPEIFADPGLNRAIANVIDYILCHGEPASKINIQYQESAKGLDLIFEDDGAGIPGTEKEKIFERGYGKDNGYGLFLAREILAITGLSIQERGEFGKGSKFIIQVPKRAYRFK